MQSIKFKIYSLDPCKFNEDEIVPATGLIQQPKLVIP
jgi:hypothetical protein